MKEPTSVRIVVKSWANEINTCRDSSAMVEILRSYPFFVWVLVKATWRRAEERVQLFNFDKRVDNRSQIIYL